MPRDLPIGNGNILIAFNRSYLLSEFYYPNVGQESHMGEPFRFGVWVNGRFSWVPDGWKIQMNYLDDSLVTQVEMQKDALKILSNDLVDFHEDLYLKKLTVENLSDQKQEVRLFFCHNFHIYGNNIGDTAEYRPETHSLLHYKGDRYFLINIHASEKFGIDSYATGDESTWRDAEDGVLGGNPIAQGSVGSVASVSFTLEPKSKETLYYWIAAGKMWPDVKRINDLIKKKGPELFMKRTLCYWKLWVNKEPLNMNLLPPKLHHLYKRSLLITRTQINNCGSIIAGNDSDVILFNRDTYSYLWPRDGALVAHALDLAGYGITVDFYNFCAKIMEKDGYFLHKYTPSGSLASSWHPWLKEGNPQLPIQEDETALVIWALWNHYDLFKDIEFIKPIYKTVIKNGADFMMNYRDPTTGLPLPSYDLWEERQGVLTFTVSTVYGGLTAAANFCEAFGEEELATAYRNGAARMRDGMSKYLYLEKEKRFARMVQFKPDGSVEVDATIDASLYGTFAFGAYAPDDEKVKNTMDQIHAKLWHHPGGGLARYENDTFFRSNPQDVGNPWFVTTLWLAEYFIAIGQLDKALSIMHWVADHALPSGVLAEQVDPITHAPLSISPLTWSHATYITIVQKYLTKLIALEKCDACGKSKHGKFAQ